MLNKNIITKLSLSVVIAIATVGCATKDPSGLLEQKNQEIAKLQEQIKTKDSQISTLQSNEKNDNNAVSNSLVPANAKAGECYAKVLAPAIYKKETKKRLVHEAQNKIIVTPATYKVIDKTFTICNARFIIAFTLSGSSFINFQGSLNCNN